MEVLATTNSCLQFKGNAKFDFCEIPPTSWLLHLKNWCFVSWTGSGILKKACKWKLYMLNVIKYISICFKCVIMQIKRFFKMNNIMQWNNTRNSSLILWRRSSCSSSRLLNQNAKHTCIVLEFIGRAIYKENLLLFIFKSLKLMISFKFKKNH